MTQQFFGHYRLIRRVAQGGMAVIHLARTSRFPQWVALKRILPDLAEQKEFHTMFMDEARLASRFEHPSLVKVLEWGHVEGHAFMAMEFLEGPTLGALVAEARKRGNPLSLALCCHIIARAAEGLHHAHTARGDDGEPLNVVHRDVSPQNLMVTRHGEVKVVDFGVAKAAGNETNTQTGVVKGKIGYMSPEHCQTEPLDARTDVYSLAVVLHELVTGQKMHGGDEHPIVVVRRIISEDAPRPSSLNKEIPRALDKIILGALHRDRRKRTPDMLSFALALDAWVRKEVGEVDDLHLAAWMRDHAAHLCPVPGVGALAEKRALPPLPPDAFPVPGPTLAEAAEPSVILTRQIVGMSDAAPSGTRPILGRPAQVARKGSFEPPAAVIDNMASFEASIALLRSVVSLRGRDAAAATTWNPWESPGTAGRLHGLTPAWGTGPAFAMPFVGAPSVVTADAGNVLPVAWPRAAPPEVVPAETAPPAVGIRRLHWPSTPFHEWRRAHDPEARPPAVRARFLVALALTVVAAGAGWAQVSAMDNHVDTMAPAPTPTPRPPRRLHVTVPPPAPPPLGTPLPAPSAGVLRIFTQPAGAEVTVEGTHVGTTGADGLLVPDLPIRDPVEVRVSRTGYLSARFTVRLIPGEVTTLPLVELRRTTRRR